MKKCEEDSNCIVGNWYPADDPWEDNEHSVCRLFKRDDHTLRFDDDEDEENTGAKLFRCSNKGNKWNFFTDIVLGDQRQVPFSKPRKFVKGFQKISQFLIYNILKITELHFDNHMGSQSSFIVGSLC